jgi:LPXTG-motif cell wall-anchored protein
MQMKSRLFSAGLCLALLNIAPFARGDVFNKKTYISFSQPVRVPGKTLDAGSYVFKLADNQANRHIVQIMNSRENKVYATVLAIPDYRARPGSKTIITFGESASGNPTPIKAWFYPGDNTGSRFVYSKQEAMELAKSYKQPVPQVPDEVVSQAANVAPIKKTPSKDPAVVAMAEAPVKAATDAGAEANYSPTTINDANDQSGFDATQAPAPSQSLPKTASPMPLIAMLGLLCLTASGLLRVARKRLG